MYKVFTCRNGVQNMTTSKFNKKRVTAFALSLLLVMQQSFTYQVVASTITSANGTVINPTGNTYNIKPDAVNGKTGYKQFDKIDLSANDILNFIYNYTTQNVDVQWNAQNGTHSIITNKQVDVPIDTFVNLVNQGVNINGIVNALESVGGNLKTDGHLMFITPGGMTIGSSGVLNVGTLSVVAPTQSSYNSLSDYLNLPKQETYYKTNFRLTENNPVTEGVYTFQYDTDTTRPLSVTTDKTFNTSTLTAGNGAALTLGGDIIKIDGKVAARGDANLLGGNIAVNNGGVVLAGVNDATVLTGQSGAATLFSSLVNDSATNSGNSFASSNGNIVITSVSGTDIANGGIVRNHSTGGNTTITNTGSNGVNVAGQLYNRQGTMTVDNSAGLLKVASTGDVKNNGTMNFTNSGTGMNIAGTVTNNIGNATFRNTSGQLLVDTTGTINSNATGTNGLTVYNNGNGGMDIQGKVNINHTTRKNTVNFTNENSNMTIGSNIKNNIESNADVNITVNDGNLYNNGVAHNLIATSNGADLNINVTNGAIGKEVQGCDGGVCTGIGRDARDLTKSINTSIDGNIKAISSGSGSLANMASLGKDMHVDQIKADGRVILLADGENTSTVYGVTKTTGSGAYNIVNKSTDTTKPNVEGTGISMIASGAIGENSKALTFRQNGSQSVFYGDDATQGHDAHKHVPSPNTTLSQGVDMLANGNINVNGMDADNGNKVDTNVCAIISREGDIKAQFSGDTYIKETTAKNNIDILTRGKNLYVEHLGEAPDTYASANGSTDYYGGKSQAPEKAKLTALDLGTYWSESEANGYEHAADSTIVVKNGTLRGKGEGRPAHEQDLTLVADNAYAGGYYFNMGKHRGKVSNEPKFNPSYYTKDSTTNELTNETDPNTPISIRAKAVRPEDDIPEGHNADERNYYYGGSSQGDDEGYDGVDNSGHNTDKNGTTEDDDNLVVPEDEENVVDTDMDTDTDTDTDIDNDTDTDIDTDTDMDNDTDTDTDTDLDSDTDIDTDSDSDTDTDTDTDIDIDTDTDTDIDTDTDTDTDTDIDNDTDMDNDSDTDTDTDADTDTDIDTDSDNDTDADTDTDMDTDNDTDTDVDTDVDTDTDTDIDNDTDLDADSDTDTDTDADTDTDIDTDTDNDTDLDTDLDDDPDITFGDFYKQRVVTDWVDSIDKRQYMRFSTSGNQNPISFESNSNVLGLADISRGGVSLTHQKTLKVGDVVPVHIQYGDLEVNADVKIVSASDVKAGGQFVNLDKATANKLLYLSMLTKDEPIAEVIQNISAVSIDE